MGAIIDPKYADLQACCVCLGFRDENEYKVDADAAVSIRSILRYLRNESAGCDVRLELGKLKILTCDLIPLLKVSQTDPILFDLVVRLMVNLTQPAVVCFRNEIPTDRDLYAAFLKVDTILKDYKNSFADEQLFRVLADRVGNLLNKSWEDRSDDDRLLIERILILIRNVLHISPDVATEHRTDEDVSIHDQLLWTIHLSGWDELILFLANTKDEISVFAFHILEIISLMLREQDPEQLAFAGTSSIDDSSTQVLKRCHLREQDHKREALVNLNMRHNRFGGTFELLNTKSISSRPLIYHHDVTTSLRRNRLTREDCGITTTFPTALDAIEQVNLDLGKQIRRKALNRKPLIEREFYRRSILSVQLFLQKFCWRFLCNCYNLLMGTARGAILRQSTQANDETYYLWSMRFFMAFCRFYKYRPQYLSESLSVTVFNWIFTLSMGYREALLTDKRGGAKNQHALQCSRRLALAVSACRQFLHCLQEMIKPSKEEIPRKLPNCEGDMEGEEEELEAREHRMRTQKQVAESLMSNIFYVAEYQDLFVLLLKEYNEAIQSKEYLVELVEGARLFINLLSSLEQSTATLVVSRRQRRRHRREKRRLERAAHRQHQKELAETRKRLLERANETVEERNVRLARSWALLSSNLIALFTGAIQPMSADDYDSLPRLFDPAAAATDAGSMGAQLRNAIRLVRQSLNDNQIPRALAIARSMWDIWPEASPSNEVEEENEEQEDLVAEKEHAIEAGLDYELVAQYFALRRIFFLDLAEEELEVTEAEIRAEETWIDNDEEEELIRHELEDSDDEKGDFEVLEKEVAFDISAFLLRFTHPLVIRSLTLLLANYALNPPSTNTHLVHLFHMIAVKHRLPGSLFQLRLFRVFQGIIRDPVVGKLQEFNEMVRLIKYILRKFFLTFERSATVAVETLFFKSTKEAAEAYSGYGTYELKNKASQWTVELDKELDQLFEAYRYDPVPEGEDLVDVLRRNLSDPEKTRRQIISRLMYLGKVASAKNLKMMTIHLGEGRGVRRSRQRRPLWSEEEVNLLQSLFLEHNGSTHRLDDVMNELKLEYEQRVRQEGDETSAPPVLRSRKEVGRKLIELGMASDPIDFGIRRRQARRHRERIENETQLETLHGGISVMKKTKTSSRRRRRAIRRESSSPELLFNTTEHFSEEDYQVPHNVATGDEDGVPEKMETPIDNKRRNSTYFDPDDSSEANSDISANENTLRTPLSASSERVEIDDLPLGNRGSEEIDDPLFENRGSEEIDDPLFENRRSEEIDDPLFENRGSEEIDDLPLGNHEREEIDDLSLGNRGSEEIDDLPLGNREKRRRVNLEDDLDNDSLLNMEIDLAIREAEGITGISLGTSHRRNRRIIDSSDEDN